MLRVKKMLHRMPLIVKSKIVTTTTNFSYPVKCSLYCPRPSKIKLRNKNEIKLRRK